MWEFTLLDNEKLLAGNHQVNLDGTNYPVGIYYYTMQIGTNVTTQKIVKLK